MPARDQFVIEFEQHSGRHDSAELVAGLNAGLNLLGHMLYLRLHEDVQMALGADSMLSPVSEPRTRRRAMAEIDLYQAAESAVMVRQAGYLPEGCDWYASWLVGLRLGEPSQSPACSERVDGYLSQPERARRLAMTNMLSAVLPDSRRAPLVLFVLFPLAVQVVTATAFGDHAGAEKLRNGQVELLSIIPSCPECRGRVLKNGESCPRCANPLWKTEWLNSA
jgi:hypothetical protein